MTETGKTTNSSSAGADAPDGFIWADPVQLGRAGQAVVETGLACWQEMLSFSQARAQQNSDALARLWECRTPADALQLQAEQGKALADACVREADELGAIVRDRLLAPLPGGDGR